ncbi:hypothetical protein BH09ACT6_BH09ACT6_04110 [soil metagenome]
MTGVALDAEVLCDAGASRGDEIPAEATASESMVEASRATEYGRFQVVDMVAATPMWRVCEPRTAASGTGSCLGATKACFRYTSREPANESGMAIASSKRMKSNFARSRFFARSM